MFRLPEAKLTLKFQIEMNAGAAWMNLGGPECRLQTCSESDLERLKSAFCANTWFIFYPRCTLCYTVDSADTIKWYMHI
jgi:hypothetical protein